MRSKIILSVLACAALLVPAAAAGYPHDLTAGTAAHEREHHKLVGKDHRLAKHKAYLHHRKVRAGRKATISRWGNKRLANDIHRLRRHVLGPAADPGIRARLRSIAHCESHGNPRAVNSTGTYRGKYQMSLRTWHVAGGHGDPIDAPEWEQDRRAGIILVRYGAGQWPVCGR